MSSYNVIGGVEFPTVLFDQQIKEFIESFSYTSLSIELAFNEIKEIDNRLKNKRVRNKNNALQFISQSKNTQTAIISRIKFMCCFIAIRRGYFNCNIGDPNEIEEKFRKYYGEYSEDIPYLASFSENKFDENLSYPDISLWIEEIGKLKKATEEATTMKKDYIDAFLYALYCDQIGIEEIKEINARVNENSANKTERGVYKKVNNTIPGATFITTDKSLVPAKMTELIYKYYNEWSEKIPQIDYRVASEKEKHNYWNEVAKREAKFHIEFERIHPFEDGNGRTGRIILNANLLKQTMAPILITGVISDEYKNFINNNDSEGFTKYITLLSSQVLTMWISRLRMFKNIPLDTVNFGQPSVLVRKPLA